MQVAFATLGAPAARACNHGGAGGRAEIQRRRYLRHERATGYLVTNDMRFDDQVAVITGAGGGLGKQYALLLASRGARVVVNDTGASVTGAGSNADAAAAVADEVRRHGGEAIPDTHSVTSPEGGQAIVDAALRSWGRIDIVINNAGIVRDAPFEDMTADRFDPLLDVHLRARFA